MCLWGKAADNKAGRQVVFWPSLDFSDFLDWDVKPHLKSIMHIVIRGSLFNSRAADLSSGDTVYSVNKGYNCIADGTFLR